MFYENWFLKTENINSFARNCAIFAFIKTASCKALKLQNIKTHVFMLHFFSLLLLIYTLTHITLAGSELNIQVNFNFVKYAQ